MDRRALIRLAFALLAIAFFAAPVALRAVGVHANAFENRRLAQAPELSQGWEVFQQATRFLTDRMPLREQAVRANTKLWDNVFSTAPRYGSAAKDRALPFGGAPGAAGAPPGKPQAQAGGALRGRDGWLYVPDELSTMCKPAVPFPQAIRRWEQLVSLVRASGRRAVMLIPPDKGSIYPEHLPADLSLTRCAKRGKREFWEQVSRLPHGSGLVGLREELLSLKRQTSDLVYSKSDTHWTTVGAIALVRAALASVGRGVQVAPGEYRPARPQPLVGDLSVLLGDPRSETVPQRIIRRSPTAPRVPGRTLFVHDSFGYAPMALLSPYFEDLDVMLWDSVKPAQAARRIAAADTVIFENVERSFTTRAGAGTLDPTYFRQLRAALPPR